jgi:metallo-beta-lactamase family protein
LPLYTESDAFACLKQLQTVPYQTFHDLPGGAQWRYFPAGHILGSAFVELYFPNGERILMSGDLGRYDTPILIDPTTIDFAEYLVVESTYGDRLHPVENTEDHLERIISDSFERGGAILVPSFAIGRTQELLYHLKKLQQANRLPRIPIFVDSPMASSTTQVYEKAAEERDEEAKISFEKHDDPLEPEGLVYIRDREQSKALNSQHGPMIVIAGSGMVNGGRIVHHMIHRIGDPSTTVLFTGYQAEGTLGRRILEKTPVVHILGQEVRVAAKIEKLNALSAHADQGEILRWLRGFKTAPKRTFIVHGEPPAQEGLREKIVSEFGWNVAIPEHLQEFELA